LAVIAGGSDGTGEAYARQLAAFGINLMLISRRAEVLEALAAELRAAHGRGTRCRDARWAWRAHGQASALASVTHGDQIQFDHALFANFTVLNAPAAQVGQDVVITYDAADKVTLAGVQLSSLHTRDVLFV
jgi:NAD(P)-dependent dehydrogenase (short-subunit alcohol dehydrogenase family)